MNDVSKAEEKLKKHAAVEMCALIGTEELGSIRRNDVTLVVKKSEDYSEKPNDIVIAELMAYARDILPPREVPKKITFVDTIPLASTGEIDRKALQLIVLR